MTTTRHGVDRWTGGQSRAWDVGILLVVRRQEMNDILLEALLVLLVTSIERDCEPARGTRIPKTNRHRP